MAVNVAWSALARFGVSLGSNGALQGSRIRHQLGSGASTAGVASVIGQLRAQMALL
jgi:hypothetical protein